MAGIELGPKGIYGATTYEPAETPSMGNLGMSTVTVIPELSGSVALWSA